MGTMLFRGLMFKKLRCKLTSTLHGPHNNSFLTEAHIWVYRILSQLDDGTQIRYTLYACAPFYPNCTVNQHFSEVGPPGPSVLLRDGEAEVGSSILGALSPRISVQIPLTHYLIRSTKS